MKQGKDRASILVFIPSYRPGFKGGGPIASLEAIVRQLGDDFSWTIATSDRDSGESASYPDIAKNWPLVKGGLNVLYLKPGLGRLSRLAELLRHDYDLLYLNDMFSPSWGVWPLLLHRLGWLKGRPVLIAPRNQFSLAALSFKSLKKRLFLWTARRVALWQGLLWQATHEQEKKEICRQVGTGARVWIGPELSNAKISIEGTLSFLPPGGPLRIIFLARISPMKNLEYALLILKGLPFPVLFDIYGPVDDANYWEKLQAMICCLPRHISANYLGPVEPACVQDLFASYHAALLPTRGENFGHTILEALAAGCPPIISDRTPWKDLGERGCGWVISLEDMHAFRRALSELNAMAPEECERMRAKARQYAEDYIENPEAKELNLRMFREVLGG